MWEEGQQAVWRSGVSCVLAMLTMWTMLGNGMVIVSLCRYPTLRSVPNLLIGNLATSDFLLALTVLPLSSINDILGEWIFGMAVCNIWLSLDVLYCTASIWSLVAIAFDRFTATVFPLWYREQRNVRRFCIYALLVWLLSIIICLPPLIGWDGRRFIDPVEKFHRALVPIDNSSARFVCELFREKNYVIYSATGSFILPLIIMMLLYCRIFAVLQQRARVLRENQRKRQSIATTNAASSAAADAAAAAAASASADADADNATTTGDEYGETTVQSTELAHASNAKRRSLHHILAAKRRRRSSIRHMQRADAREQRATHRMLIIIVIFIICWIPFTLMYLVRSLADLPPSDSLALEALQALAIWLGYANSGLNPILYTVFNKDFRTAFSKLLNACNPCKYAQH